MSACSLSYLLTVALVKRSTYQLSSTFGSICVGNLEPLVVIKAAYFFSSEQSSYCCCLFGNMAQNFFCAPTASPHFLFLF